jgi:hypothetical protein
MNKSQRMPKDQYFQKRYAECIAKGLTRKASYYRGRLEEMGSPLTKPVTQTDKDNLKARVAAKTERERIDIAVKIINDGDAKGFPAQNVMHYLTDGCGLTMNEYLSALNIATDGELLRTAMD